MNETVDNEIEHRAVELTEAELDAAAGGRSSGMSAGKVSYSDLSVVLPLD